MAEAAARGRRCRSRARRYENGSATIVTTNRSLPAWGEVFGDAVAAAILERLLHRAVVFNIKGPSWRMKEPQALTEGARA